MAAVDAPRMKELTQQRNGEFDGYVLRGAAMLVVFGMFLGWVLQCCMAWLQRLIRTPKVKTYIDSATQTDGTQEDAKSSLMQSSVARSGVSQRRGKLAGVELTGDPMQALLSRLTVPALRSALRSRRMLVSGLKAELVARLLASHPPPTVAEIDALAREHYVNVLG